MALKRHKSLCHNSNLRHHAQENRTDRVATWPDIKSGASWLPWNKNGADQEHHLTPATEKDASSCQAENEEEKNYMRKIAPDVLTVHINKIIQRKHNFQRKREN